MANNPLLAAAIRVLTFLWMTVALAAQAWGERERFVRPGSAALEVWRLTNDPTVRDTPSYMHYDVGLSTRYSRLTIDMRWYDNEEITGVFQRWSAGSRLVASVSVAF